MKIRNTAFAATLFAAAALLAPIYGPAIRAHAASADEVTLDRSMKSVMDAYGAIEKNFADKVSSEKAFYQGAIPGMLHTLDPHSNFVDPADYREMQRKQRASYRGVGMQISMDGPHVVVMEPFPGSPAWNAGLRRGDWIAAVDDKDTKGLDSAAVADMLRGERGTQVKVTVRREGATEPVSYTVTRGDIETSIVDAFWLKPGIAYVHITSFEAQNVAKDIDNLLRKMGEENVQGLVLDLRDNPGGLVNEAVSVAGRFLRNGQIVVSHRGRAEQEQVFRAKANPLAQKYPIVTLVNGRSASAAEIVSGALQDHDRAWVMGETTFGKGLVQAQFPLDQGAALLLTIAHYYTPSGRLIQRDYSHQSFFDYYYAKRSETTPTDDVKPTDSGRKVYGGGGITPDEKYPGPHLNPFQRRVLSSGSFYHFGNVYFGGSRPSLPANWEPDTDTLNRFRDFARTQPGVTFTDADFDANRGWVRDQMRYELLFRAFDKKTADRAQWQEDPEIQKAIESLPKAQSLLKDVQRVLAMRK
ncbi:MAG TPA: S41 family peptidase [Bryobacteraceae bacterium]